MAFFYLASSPAKFIALLKYHYDLEAFKRFPFVSSITNMAKKTPTKQTPAYNQTNVCKLINSINIGNVPIDNICKPMKAIIQTVVPILRICRREKEADSSVEYDLNAGRTTLK